MYHPRDMARRPIDAAGVGWIGTPGGGRDLLTLDQIRIGTSPKTARRRGFHTEGGQ